MTYDFSLISDVHLDSWISDTAATPKQEKMVNKMADIISGSLFRPNVLVIAGDIGHSNIQAKMFFHRLSDIYEHVLFVLGNHDYYVFNTRKFADSNERIQDLLGSLPYNVHFLDNTTFEYNGITYGGANIWCDGSFARDVYGIEDATRLFNSSMNDSLYTILPAPLDTFNGRAASNAISEEVAKADVIITHMPPMTLSKMPDPTDTFYQFDSSRFNCTPKVWCCGHTHNRVDIRGRYRTVTNPLGYIKETSNSSWYNIDRDHYKMRAKHIKL